LGPRRFVILPARGRGAFGTVPMPDGSEALVLDREVHEKALVEAGRKLADVTRCIKESAMRAGKAR
jgi:hypothetical protein